MKTSAAGIGFIKSFEGCVLRAYLDMIAKPPRWTIGYGDTLNVEPNMQITQQQAEDRLAGRLAREFEPGVMTAIGDAPTTQPQFDAMVSLEWNIGVEAFARSTVARLHHAGDYLNAAAAFRLFDMSGGKVVPALVRRREEELTLYLSAAPAPAPAARRTLYLDTPMMRGSDVTEMQRLLDEAAAPCDVDGTFGRQTRDALMTFQRRHARLRVDGICGKATWAALLAA